MGLPGHRRTSGDKRRRAAHFALKATSIGICPECKKPLLPHRACLACGSYKGRKVVKPARITKKTSKKSTKKAS